MSTINQAIVDDLKKINWQFIIDYSNSLDDLNERQFRFMKGWIIELLVENQEKDNNLIYLGEDHRDYFWPKHNISAELKSVISGTLYTTKAELKGVYNLQYTNSNGTNKDLLDPNLVCDITIIVKSDGCVIVDKETVLKNLKHNGDGFRLNIPKNELVEISGRVEVKTKYDLDFKTLFQKVIKESIRVNDPCLKK